MTTSAERSTNSKDVVERHNSPEVEACKHPKVVLNASVYHQINIGIHDIEYILARGMTRILSLRFMEDVDWKISEMKLSLNARARIVAKFYFGHVVASERIPVKETGRPMGASEAKKKIFRRAIGTKDKSNKLDQRQEQLTDQQGIEEDRHAELEKLKIAHSDQHLARDLLEWAGKPEITALSRHCKKMIQVIQAKLTNMRAKRKGRREIGEHFWRLLESSRTIDGASEVICVGSVWRLECNCRCPYGANLYLWVMEGMGRTPLRMDASGTLAVVVDGLWSLWDKDEALYRAD
ncbi:hypothetical protein PPACK8108_LOCUS12626 [Phakopsora pachyrhizi]|uniref:Uncharacterized protein n=1 Tax=Phakopsora pachyrhizi TaxID=170000 RepID=A0AAV0B3K3_PHAPC|nr:hypothetical protein PPACK8108_LOCUS12626 [Phakopsora pachyrhizi]